MRTITPVEDSSDSCHSQGVPPPASPCAVDRPEVEAPGIDRPISVFAEEVGRILRSTGRWFERNNRAVILRESQVADAVPGACSGTTATVFHYPLPSECRSLIERWVNIGHRSRDGAFVSQSLGKDTTAALLDSPQFKECLPPIRRILDVPVPILVEGRFQMVQPGYNPDLQAYCLNQVSGVEPLPLHEAKAVVDEILEGFPFSNDLSKTVAIARILTPMCRGIMGWTARTPLWVFEANRPRAGKDYLAGCTGVLYEGRANEDAPLDHDPKETHKRIVAALQSGRRFMHFANTSGDIRNDAFEQAVTAKVISGRLLGSNDAASDLTMSNELEFSVSGNSGFTFTEDFALRSRRISLSYFEEDANSRVFRKPQLHEWILQNRQRVLGALAGMVQEWVNKGQTPGPTPFTSFHEWARVVGGTMAVCGLGDPCKQQTDGTFTRDTLTEDMRCLFGLAVAEKPGQWLTKSEVRGFVRAEDHFAGGHDMDLFLQWDLEDRKGQTAFGQALSRYKGRVLGGVRMEADATDKKRVKYRFVPVCVPKPAQDGGIQGNEPPAMGTLGTLGTEKSGDGRGGVVEDHETPLGGMEQTIPKVPKVPELQPLDWGNAPGLHLDTVETLLTSRHPGRNVNPGSIPAPLPATVEIPSTALPQARLE